MWILSVRKYATRRYWSLRTCRQNLFQFFYFSSLFPVWQSSNTLEIFCLNFCISQSDRLLNSYRLSKVARSGKRRYRENCNIAGARTDYTFRSSSLFWTRRAYIEYRAMITDTPIIRARVHFGMYCNGVWFSCELLLQRDFRVRLLRIGQI